jgi:hypothetical protein
MSSSEFVQLIAQAQSAVAGEIIDRSRVVDVLLDLRNAAEAVPALVEAVDASLKDVPGKTMVRSAWWRETLDELSLAAAIEEHREPAAG